jgi:[CysO sulfur-carrier protein]-S-L-cysteine hydrolase
MTLRLPEGMIGEIFAHAYTDLPNECCGIIAGKAGEAAKLYRTRNAEASPYRYNIDPRDLLRIEQDLDANGWEVLVIYHSHVASEAYPSPTDVRLSQWPGTDPPSDLFPGAHYVLVSLRERAAPVLRSYRISGGSVAEEEIEAVGGKPASAAGA